MGRVFLYLLLVFPALTGCISEELRNFGGAYFADFDYTGRRVNFLYCPTGSEDPEAFQKLVPGQGPVMHMKRVRPQLAVINAPEEKDAYKAACGLARYDIKTDKVTFLAREPRRFVWGSSHSRIDFINGRKALVTLLGSDYREFYQDKLPLSRRPKSNKQYTYVLYTNLDGSDQHVLQASTESPWPAELIHDSRAGFYYIPMDKDYFVISRGIGDHTGTSRYKGTAIYKKAMKARSQYYVFNNKSLKMINIMPIVYKRTNFNYTLFRLNESLPRSRNIEGQKPGEFRSVALMRRYKKYKARLDRMNHEIDKEYDRRRRFVPYERRDLRFEKVEILQEVAILLDEKGIPYWVNWFDDAEKYFYGDFGPPALSKDGSMSIYSMMLRKPLSRGKFKKWTEIFLCRHKKGCRGLLRPRWSEKEALAGGMKSKTSPMGGYLSRGGALKISDDKRYILWSSYPENVLDPEKQGVFDYKKIYGPHGLWVGEIDGMRLKWVRKIRLPDWHPDDDQDK